jgi:hypothetical protein
VVDKAVVDQPNHDGAGSYGTELAAAGIDLLVLRDLIGYASPETTATYVHCSLAYATASAPSRWLRPWSR